MAEEGDRKSAKDKVSEGIRQGIGVLSAFKDALEETIQEARERGDISSERAKEVMKSALHRAQSAAGSARERLDFVTQSELDAVVAEVRELRARIDRLEGRAPGEQGGPGGEADAEAG